VCQIVVVAVVVVMLPADCEFSEKSINRSEKSRRLSPAVYTTKNANLQHPVQIYHRRVKSHPVFRLILLFALHKKVTISE
jgi:hypothetical protein